MALVCGNAMADTGTEFPAFSLRGFGTIGLAHSSEDKADFLAHDLQAKGAGYSRDWSPDVDSRVGIQLDARFMPQLSGVLQVVSEQRSDGSYRPEVEWANVKYEVTADLSLRAGRIVLPTFMVSDYRKVGYAMPWVRPPVEVYSLVPLTRSDGADVSYRTQLGEFKNTVQVKYGESSADLVDSGGKVKGKNGWGIANTLERGPATLRVSYFKSDFSVDSPDLNTLLDGFRQFGPQGAAIANKYDPSDKTLTFLSVGGSYDPGKWFVMGEWGATDSHSLYGKREAWYVSGGYRFGKFTPYATYSRVGMKSKTFDPGLPPPLPQVSALAATLNAQLNAVLAEGPDQETASLGARWDFAKNAAFKMQFDHSNIGKGSPGTLDHMQPGFEPGGKYNVFSVVIDFLF